MGNEESNQPRIVVRHKDTRKPLPDNYFKYPSYKGSDAFPVLGAIDFGIRNHEIKNEFRVKDSNWDITKKVAFYTAHASTVVGSVAMAIEPVREKVFDFVENIGNYLL